MLEQTMMDKLMVLADSAKYDVSCASSGIEKKNKGGIGNATACGICHTWSSDGRCVSLLKTLVTNDCIFDCAYCVNRVSNDIARASFSAQEVAKLTIEFYRRNYIEGLFLSSAVEISPNHTMEKILEILRILRHGEKFFGYIHVKAIPGADPILIKQAGLLADRMSVNIELPTIESLRLLAPQKNPEKLYLPMKQIAQGIIETKEDNLRTHHKTSFVPAGQSTQMVIGATPDTDRSIIFTSEHLYKKYQLKRVYYSAYMPVNEGKLLPAISTAPPLLREHRLYQADWLMRFYHFSADEIVEPDQLNLDLEFDPKMSWAFRHIEVFPIEINKATYQELLRIPGIGMISAKRIVKQRQIQRIRLEDLKKLGVVVKRAQFFLTCEGKFMGDKRFDVPTIKEKLNPKPTYEQLALFQEFNTKMIPMR
jgi:putative DNA modification/repair radical SAM protein